jgi:hypothetical protein
VTSRNPLPASIRRRPNSTASGGSAAAASPARTAAPLQAGHAPDTSRLSSPSERPMAGIGVIILFLLAIAVLNRVEFGRFD